MTSSNHCTLHQSLSDAPKPSRPNISSLENTLILKYVWSSWLCAMTWHVGFFCDSSSFFWAQSFLPFASVKAKWGLLQAEISILTLRFPLSELHRWIVASVLYLSEQHSLWSALENIPRHSIVASMCSYHWYAALSIPDCILLNLMHCKTSGLLRSLHL